MTIDTAPHLPPSEEYRSAKLHAQLLGLRLDMNMYGTFVLYRLSDGAEHNSREAWPAMLDLLRAMERARREAGHGAQ